MKYIVQSISITGVKLHSYFFSLSRRYCYKNYLNASQFIKITGLSSRNVNIFNYYCALENKLVLPFKAASKDYIKHLRKGHIKFYNKRNKKQYQVHL